MVIVGLIIYQINSKFFAIKVIPNLLTKKIINMYISVFVERNYY